MQSRRPAVVVAWMVVLAGVLPALIDLAAHWGLGDTPWVNERLHEVLELTGACIALVVAMLVLLRLRHMGGSPDLLWVVAALVAMGLADGVHASVPFGRAWSWLRHGSTLAGGLLVAMVWLPPVPGLVGRAREGVVVVAGATVALCVLALRNPGWLPQPFVPGGYADSVRAANAIGGLGFLAASLFFARRYLARPGREELALAAQAALFGVSGLLFGFATVWAADWWAWHLFRLLAYGIVLWTAYATVAALFRGAALRAVHLEERVVWRTAELERAREARVVAERERRESEETLRSAFANATIGFAVTEPEGRFVTANAAYCGILGYGLDELKDFSFPTLIHPDDRAANMARVASMLAGEIPAFVAENRYVRKDASAVWVRKSVSLVRDPKGAPRWIIALIEDISDRVRAEELLRQSREDLDRAQAVGQIGWWRLDTRRDVLTWSDENHRIFGVPKGTPLTYETFLAIIHPDDRDRVDRQWAAGLRGDPYDIEHRIVADGRVKWVREKAFLEFDGSGALLGGFGITQDITKLKAAEQHLHEVNATLEQRVAERTREIQRSADRLRALAADLTRTEQRERERLARTLHDHFQQLLFSAQIQVSLIPKSDPDAIQRSVDGVDAVLREALAASRSLTVELCPPVLHRSGLAAALSWLAANMLEQRHLAVRVDASREAEPGEPETRAFLFDAARELLLNVAKHARVDRAAVRLRRTAGGDWELVVEDEGRGFERAAVTPGQEGGFGLFSVEQRTLHMGGTLSVETAPGKGTRVTLRVPDGGVNRASAGGGPAARAASESGDPGCLPPDGSRRPIRVLLADDHRITREGLSRLLEFEGDIEIVAQAEDGRQAVEMARRSMPDVVVMDVDMPVMDGCAATRVIAAEVPGVHVIGLSMHGGAEDERAMRDAGAVGYLTKTGAAEGLIAAIRKAARGGEAPGEAAAHREPGLPPRRPGIDR